MVASGTPGDATQQPKAWPMPGSSQWPQLRPVVTGAAAAGGAAKAKAKGKARAAAAAGWVDEQDHQRKDGGQDLRCQADVTAREEGESQHSKQHLQQHQGDLSSNDVVQIGLPVLFAVLEGVHLVDGKRYCLTENFGLFA